MSHLIHPVGSRCHGVHVEHYNVVIGREPLLHRRMCCCSCGTWLGWGFSTLVVLASLALCLMAGIQSASRDPSTELEAMAIHSFNLTEDGSDLLTPWVANGNISVTFRARNPSTMVGFKHSYLYTLVSAFHEETLWSRSQLPRFSQGPKSSGNVTANLVVDNQHVNQSAAWTLQRSIQNQSDIALRISVDARVRLKSEMSVGNELRWFNLTCLVNVTMPTTSEAGRMLGKTCRKSVESSMD